MSSPTQRSLAYLRAQGWTACVVEKWIPQIKQRKDAFGFGDLLAVRDTHEENGFLYQPRIALVQTTTMAHMAERRTKILALSEAHYWLKCGGKILIHGWAKKGPRGKRKTWQVKEESL